MLEISHEKHIMWKAHLRVLLTKLGNFAESINKSLKGIEDLFKRCRGTLKNDVVFRGRKCRFGRK